MELRECEHSRGNSSKQKFKTQVCLARIKWISGLQSVVACMCVGIRVFTCVCALDLRGRLIEVRGVRHVGQALAELAAELTCLSLLIAALLSPALHSPELNAFCSSLIKSLWHNVCQVFPSNSYLLFPNVFVPSATFRRVNTAWHCWQCSISCQAANGMLCCHWHLR